MNNASLNKRVVISTPTFTDDGIGGRIAGTPVLLDKYADVRNLSGNERFLFGGDNTDSMVMFIMRYFELNKTSTIIWDGINYKIDRVEFSKDKRFIKVYGRS